MDKLRDCGRLLWIALKQEMCGKRKDLFTVQDTVTIYRVK